MGKTFLSKDNRYDVLSDAGKISHNRALKRSAEEYDKFRKIQDNKYLSDFDNAIKNINNIK
ncbi:MAG: hypothetical protein B6I18_08220 [Bacteroidetes bacterium 4572_112]|nr:MAG: hypothetical protein B6I18_08220 [Bacteroidetes bacterium 4572_112]